MFFLLIPVCVQYNARRYPVVTFTLIGLNVAFYLLSLFFFFQNSDGDVWQREWVAFNLGMIPSENVWWTYFTYMFVHGGFFHLLGNMIYLFLFGACIEDLIGRWQFTLFYLFSGLMSAIIYSLVTQTGPDSAIPIVGASGAIAGCLGGFGLVLARTKINFRYFIWIIIRFWSGDFWISAWIIISLYFATDLFWAILKFNNVGQGGVAFAAHVGGMLVGAGLIGIWKLLPQRFKPADEDDETGVERVQVNLSSSPEVQEAASIYLYYNKTQFGPFTSSQVTQMLALGSISPDTSYWQKGMAEWLNVSRFRGG